jgi:hypothetical protein
MRACNVIIRDKHYHEMHHALGCPWPDEIMGETYRNYFAIDADTETATRMRASPHWTGGTKKFGMVYFSVTDQGKRALIDHMQANVTVPARYAITFRHYDGCKLVPARSRSAAKYASYLAAEIEWPFIEYAAEIKSVRLHSVAINPAPATP